MEEDLHQRLPSPLSTDSQCRVQVQKRKRSISRESCPDDQTPPKKPRASPECTEQVAGQPLHPVAYWVATQRWPEGLEERDLRMRLPNPSKRKHSSTHNSEILEQLNENGVFMEASSLMQKSSKDLCFSFLEGDRIPTLFPCFPPEEISRVLERIQPLNEARLQRDVTPWVVPSAENLYFSGEVTPDYLGDELNAEWTRPWLFTPNICFPFLICEAKTGQVGMDRADRQNIHSASIAVRAVIELYKVAFGTTSPDRVKDLYGQVLAFSVSHNNRQVNLYGHYAVSDSGSTRGLKFYRYDIDMFSLTMHDGARRYKPYNFVFNVYEKFAPEHRKRIKDALAFLPLPAQRTGLSFAASDLGLEEMDSQRDSQPAASQDGVFRTPTEPASATQRRELLKELEREKMQVTRLLQQMEQQRQESKEREEKMEEQLKQQHQELMSSLRQSRT